MRDVLRKTSAALLAIPVLLAGPAPLLAFQDRVVVFEVFLTA